MIAINVAVRRTGRSRVVKDIRAGEVDVRSGEVNLHIHVVRCRRRVDVEHRLVVFVVDKPADAVRSNSVRLGDLSLHITGAENGREVDMVAARRKVGDSVEMTSAWLRISD